MEPSSAPFAGTSTRRDFLRAGLAAAATFAIQAPAISAPPADFHFVVISDLHYRDRRCGEWLERVATHLRKLRPRPAFVALAGDLTEEGGSRQLGAVHEIFTALPMPVHSIIGNHDYAADGTRSAYERLHGARLNYRFAVGDYQFLALDTTRGRSVYRTRITAETLTWLQRQLPSLSRDRPLVVLTHFPLGRNWLRPPNAYEVLHRLRPFALQGVYSGHWHGLTERSEHGAPMVTGRCCSLWRGNHDGSGEKGYLLCRAARGTLTHEFVPVPEPAFT